MHNKELEKFSRDLSIEKSIDMKVVEYSRDFESISVFLDVLDKLISECDDVYTKNKLCKFLNYRMLKIESGYDRGMLDSEERSYVESLITYLRGLRGKFIGSKYDRRQFILYIIGSLKKIALSSLGPVDSKNEIENILRQFSNLQFYVCEKFGNFYIHVKKYEYFFCLVNNVKKYEGVDFRCFVSLVVNEDLVGLPDSIEKATNIDFISYRYGDFFEDIFVGNPLGLCDIRISRLLVSPILNVDEITVGRVRKSLSRVKVEIKELLLLYPSEIRKIDKLALEDIKKLRNSMKASSREIEDAINDRSQSYISDEMLRLSEVISATYNRIKNVLDLNKNIDFALSEIRRNNTLYIVSGNNKKTTDYAFGEENLTSILASNLRCLYRDYRNISIVCEAMVGNGRSDISLGFGNSTFSIIESKLIKEKSDVVKETLNGIHQLYERYGDNTSIEGDAALKLYLVIFSYDKRFEKMSESICLAVKQYAENNNLKHDEISSSENGIMFSYRENRGGGFKSKTRVISILVCNMEVDYKSKSKQKTNRKKYTPS